MNLATFNYKISTACNEPHSYMLSLLWYDILDLYFDPPNLSSQTSQNCIHYIVDDWWHKTAQRFQNGRDIYKCSPLIHESSGVGRGEISMVKDCGRGWWTWPFQGMKKKLPWNDKRRDKAKKSTSAKVVVDQILVPEPACCCCDSSVDTWPARGRHLNFPEAILVSLWDCSRLWVVLWLTPELEQSSLEFCTSSNLLWAFVQLKDRP